MSRRACFYPAQLPLVVLFYSISLSAGHVRLSPKLISSKTSSRRDQDFATMINLNLQNRSK